MENCKFCGLPIGDIETWTFRYEVCDGIQTWGPDPFQEEIRGDYSDYLMCAGERRQSAMEI